uniref:Uncharacterized protein n=1 Tax=Strigops habroptila TaxID=2489341 RepID=A0A672UK12_STRHB
FTLVKQVKGEKFRPGKDWEQMEETFVASSTGEGTEVIDMVQHKDSQRLRNSAVKDLHEIIAMVIDNNLNIYLCFMISS